MVVLLTSYLLASLYYTTGMAQFRATNFTLIRKPKGGLRISITTVNLQTPNVNYSWRTASLTSKVAFYIFIQQI